MDFTSDNVSESNEFLKVLLENLSSAIIILNEELYVRSFNPAFSELFQKTEARILGELCGNAIGCSFPVDENKKCGDTSHCRHCQLRKSLIKTFSSKVPVVKERLSREFFIYGKKIMKHFLYSTSAVSFNGENTVLMIVDDITELEESLARLRELAFSDSLTGLFNHKHCYELLEERVESAQRYLNDLTIILLDIDNFKAINDTWGHQTGDRVLKEISLAIRESIRHIDIAGRYGGEEFLLVLPQTGEAGAKIIAERIRKKIETLTFDEEDLRVTISGGIARHEGQSALQLVAQADILLYTAKHNGRNRIEAKH